MRAALPLIVALAALPALALAGPGAVPPDPGWTVRVAITTEAAEPAQAFRAFNPQGLQWVDVDDDGRPEILSPNTNGWLYLFDPGGPILAEVPWPVRAGYDPGQALQPGTIVGFVDGDKQRDVVATGNQGLMRLYEHDPGASGPGSIGLALRWERCLDCADGEHDGTPWAAKGRVFTQHDDAPHQWALRAGDGTTAWQNWAYDGNAGVVVQDLDRDGKPEVVFATDAGQVMARRWDTGTLRWFHDLRKSTPAAPGSIPPQPTVDDLAGDGKREVLVCARHAPSSDATKGHAVYAVLLSSGRLKWHAQLPDGNPLCHTHLVGLDINGDRVKDVLGLDWNTLGHKPGDFSRLGPARLFALDGRSGAVLWNVPVNTRWSDKDLCAADVDADGAQELLVPQDHGGVDGISVYSLQGVEEAWWPAPEGWTVARGALCVPWQGRLHLVLSLARPAVREGLQSPDGTSPVGQLLLVDAGVPYDAAWSGQFIHKT